MEPLKVTMKIHYKDDKPSKVEEISLWHGNKPFVFVDDSNVKCVSIQNRIFYTQEEYNAFFYGVEHVRNILVSLVNL